MSPIYSCGIIGTGFIGCEAEDSHARAYMECNKTILRAFCDTDLKKAQACQRKFLHSGGTVTDSYKGLMIIEACDLVSVCTPPETHRKIVCDIAPYVKAIWCEKPIALTLEDADEMIRICRENDTLLMINHQRDFLRPKVRFSRGIINTGTHAFALLLKLGLSPEDVNIEYIDTDEHIFEFDFTHNKERMLRNVLDNILEGGSNATQAREALRLALAYEASHH